MDINSNQSQFQFNRPVLKEAIFTVNSDYEKKLADIGPQNFKVISKISNKESDNSNHKIASVLVTITSNEKLRLDEHTPFVLRVTMAAVFRANENISEEQFINLLKVNAPSLIMSYIRPVVTQLTEQSDIETQYIPFLDFTQAEKG